MCPRGLLDVMNGQSWIFPSVCFRGFLRYPCLLWFFRDILFLRLATSSCPFPSRCPSKIPLRITPQQGPLLIQKYCAFCPTPPAPLSQLCHSHLWTSREANASPLAFNFQKTQVKLSITLFIHWTNTFECLPCAAGPILGTLENKKEISALWCLSSNSRVRQ